MKRQANTYTKRLSTPGLGIQLMSKSSAKKCSIPRQKEKKIMQDWYLQRVIILPFIFPLALVETWVASSKRID